MNNDNHDPVDPAGGINWRSLVSILLNLAAISFVIFVTWSTQGWIRGPSTTATGNPGWMDVFLVPVLAIIALLLLVRGLISEVREFRNKDRYYPSILDRQMKSTDATKNVAER